MKALVYTGPEELEMQDVPAPRPDPGDALVEIAFAGICGSDMHAYLGHDERRPAPLILGHEAAGTVLDGPMKGTRVTINPLVSCGECRACLEGRENLCGTRQIISMPPREGAFAEQVALPARNLTPVPQDFPLEKAALAEPLACGWHGVRLAAQALGAAASGQKALVIGGGAIGLGAALVLAAHHAGEIWLAETSPARRAVLERAGDFRVFDPMSSAGPSNVDMVIDGVGFAATRSAATTAVRPGGVIVHIGLGGGAPGLDIRRMTLQEITFIGAYTYIASDFRETAAAIINGQLGPLDWMEIRPLAEGAQSFKDIQKGAAAPKIILAN